MSSTDNDGATVVGEATGDLDGNFVVICFDGNDVVVITGLLVGFLEGSDDGFKVGVLVDIEPSNDNLDVGTAVRICGAEYVK